LLVGWLVGWLVGEFLAMHEVPKPDISGYRPMSLMPVAYERLAGLPLKKAKNPAFPKIEINLLKLIF
jgi:hypothetical protein